MSNPNRPGGIKPDADDIQAYQRERRTRMVDRIGDVPNVGGGGGASGGAGGWLQWLVILLLLGGAYYLYQQLDLARAQQTLDQQRIMRLEKQLNITDESVSESSDQMQKQVQFLDTEIRKLWDNVWKKSKDQLADHETRLEKMEKSLSSLDGQFDSLSKKIAAAEKTVEKDRKELASLRVQLQKTQSMAETNWSEIAELKEGGDVAERIARLESRVKANEEWVESVNSFRKQVNRDMTSLRDTMSTYHGGASQ